MPNDPAHGGHDLPTFAESGGRLHAEIAAVERDGRQDQKM
jgi:hypothetical protein